MIKLEKNNILELHKLIIKETGGSNGVREMFLLESALESPFITFNGEDLFQTIEEKAAKLGFSLISNHAFIDGNKRIGILVMLVFLDINGIKLETDNRSIVEIVMNTATGKCKYHEILEWIYKFKIQ